MPGKPNAFADLLQQATTQYPFIQQYNPVVTAGKGAGDYAETWPIGETGDSASPRPSDIPIDRTGVAVFRPGEFGPSDLAAEFLHVDPIAHATRQILMGSLSREQQATLKHAAGDYQDSLNQGEPEQKAMENATDSAMRGYTVGQWPPEANAEMNYSPAQINALNALRQYMTQGYFPSSYKLPGK